MTGGGNHGTKRSQPENYEPIQYQSEVEEVDYCLTDSRVAAYKIMPQDEREKIYQRKMQNITDLKSYVKEYTLPADKVFLLALKYIMQSRPVSV